MGRGQEATGWSHYRCNCNVNIIIWWDLFWGNPLMSSQHHKFNHGHKLKEALLIYTIKKYVCY